MGDNFERYVNMLPVEWQRLVAMGVKYFVEEINAQEVKLKVANNGVAIAIRTDEQSKEEAVEFWEEYVQPVLNGDE